MEIILSSSSSKPIYEQIVIQRKELMMNYQKMDLSMLFPQKEHLYLNKIKI